LFPNFISRSDFQSALGMKNSTFVDRLFAVFDENGDGGINFVEFLTILSVLSTKVSRQLRSHLIIYAHFINVYIISLQKINYTNI